MKLNLSLFSFLLLMSCSADPLVPDYNYTVVHARETFKNGAVIYGSDYESVGLVYKAIEQEIATSPSSSDLAGIKLKASQVPAFNSLYQEGYVEMSEGVLDSLAALAATDFESFTGTIGFSPAGKHKLLTIVSALLEHKNNSTPPKAIALYLVNVQDDLSSDIYLNQYDTEVLLRTVSILKHSYEPAGDNGDDDEDWELSIGHIAATAYGASLGRANCIIASLYGKFNT